VARELTVKVVLSADEALVLDEKRGSVPRGRYLRQLLHGPAPARDIATRAEALQLLTSLARDGRTQAVIALERALRDSREDDVMRWILEADD
jgi:hypothetical protein